RSRRLARCATRKAGNRLLEPHRVGPAGRSPSTTRTWWVVPSSASGMPLLLTSTATPSTSTAEIPRITPRGFSTTIAYRAEFYRKVTYYAWHARGITGTQVIG